MKSVVMCVAVLAALLAAVAGVERRETDKVVTKVVRDAGKRGSSRFSDGDGKTPDLSKIKILRSTLKSLPREVRTDYEAVPGSVVHWFSDGSARTNVVRHIDLSVVTNTVEKALEDLREQTRERLASLLAFSNQAVVAEASLASAEASLADRDARIERTIASFSKKRAEYVEKRDEAVLQTTKAIYQLFIDTIDGLVDVLDGKEETE